MKMMTCTTCGWNNGIPFECSHWQTGFETNCINWLPIGCLEVWDEVFEE